MPPTFDGAAVGMPWLQPRPHDATRRAVQFIAGIEASKGLLAWLAASGLLSLMHRDLAALALRLVEHLHLNPAAHMPHVLLDAVAQFPQGRLLWIAAGAAGYGALRLLEAWGLFRGRAWAEWLGALSGAIYLPFELAGLAQRRGLLEFAVLAVNIVVVAVMLRALQLRRQRAAAG